MAHARLSRYQEVDASTADPGRRLLMLLDGAARALRRAQSAIVTDDRRAFIGSMARANAILATLAEALDEAVGGKVAADLARLYEWALRHLTVAFTRRSSGHIDEVLVVLGEIRAGFEGAVEAGRRGDPAW
jgi:flagellar protein FliS